MKTNRLLTILAINAGIVLSGAALDAHAQKAGATAHGQMNMPGAKMETPAAASAPASASTQAFKASAAEMMKQMSAPGYTGDADADFVAHMIPHHQGAVAQAEVELEYGTDPKMRALARDIIHAQDKEIAYMKQWQADHNNNNR